MSCRPLPHYRPGLGWMLGVTLPSTLTSTRPAFRGFTRVRCCSLPPASSPHLLAESAVAFGSQLPPTDSAGDFHPQSIIHVQRTPSPYGLLRLAAKEPKAELSTLLRTGHFYFAGIRTFLLCLDRLF